MWRFLFDIRKETEPSLTEKQNRPYKGLKERVDIQVKDINI